jgi:hypothetical protein
MVGRDVCVGVGLAAGRGDPEGSNRIVADGALRHASVPVHRPFGGHWQLRGNGSAAGCSRGKASLRVGETGKGN